MVTTNVPTLLSSVREKKRKLKILIALYFLIIYWAQCSYRSTCQLWAPLWSDSARILQHVCADWQRNTEESGDSGGPNNWGISCNVSTIQSYCYDDRCLTTFAAKDKNKKIHEELIRTIPGIEERLVNSSEEEIIYIADQASLSGVCLHVYSSHCYSASQGSVWFQGRWHMKS